MLKTYIRAIELSAFDARDCISAGCEETAFLHARDAAHYAGQMMRAFAEEPDVERAETLSNSAAA